jgi:hypothetical protein
VNATLTGSRGRWAIAAVGATTVTFALLFLFRLPAPPTPIPVPSSVAVARPEVKMAKPDDNDLYLKEEAQLRDLRPLFLPTSRNAALPEPRLETGQSFLDSEGLRPTFSDAQAQVSKDLPPVVLLNGKGVENATPADALSLSESGTVVAGFGRQEPRVERVAQRGAFVEVIAMSNGSRLLTEELPISARPPGDSSWAPVEFMAVVDAAGLVSPLVVTEGSRVDEVDLHFRNYLAQNLRIGERLSVGFYRIVVAP